MSVHSFKICVKIEYSGRENFIHSNYRVVSVVWLVSSTLQFERKRNLENFFQFSFPWTSEVIKSRTEGKKIFSQFNKSVTMIQKNLKNSVIFNIELPNEFTDSQKYFHK